jgi:hypothetical protein
MLAEFERFKDELKSEPPGAIVLKAYEVTFKEEILIFFDYDNFIDESDAQKLLAHGNPLQEIYNGWQNSDPTPYLDKLRDSIARTIAELPLTVEWDESVTPDILAEPLSAKTLFNEVQRGDFVIAAGNSDYRYLIGTVTAIDKFGTPEHGTDNETDDVHVDFTAFDYPPDRLVEIEETFSELYGEQKAFDELSLDDVIMAPKMLISISNLSYDEMIRMGNLRENCESFCNCFMGGGSEPLRKVEDTLAETRNPPEAEEKAAEKPKPRTLADKMQAAVEKVKAQEEQPKNPKARKRDERA